VFSVTRQLRYSPDETARALDLALFINGLPVATFELKNSLTKQTTADAVAQYKRDRDPREVLFQPKRCIVHYAVDDARVEMCTELKGQASWFLPFDRGWDDGAGNPPNPHGLKTAYLWDEVLSRESLTDIIENYAQVVKEKDSKGKVREEQVFPRYHQLDVVRKLLAHAHTHGVGHRYLIQHSAGSGKSKSIAWLAHQLIDLQENDAPLFDTVVVTDRKVLDKQIRDTIRQFAQVSAVVGEAKTSGFLRSFIEGGKRIVVSTVQKFPMILDEIGDQHRDRRFAIVIDEAHSSQGGKTTAAMSGVLGAAYAADEDDEDTEDEINRIMEARKFLGNASYFAFTATPKNKTLELFGELVPGGEKPTRRPFHSYTMKQAIDEGFIVDVLRHYTPVESYYRLVKTVEGDPEFDTKRAGKKLRRYVEEHQDAVRKKAEIIVDHFHEQVSGAHLVGGQARAMVVADGVERAIEYWRAVSAYLEERHSPYQAIVAFSGEREVDGAQVTEAHLNRFPSADIPDRFRQDPYRFLIAADKFQTGYDEPLLHTMYVDKTLSGIKAVQTLSRLNRAHPHKHDTFVLDFRNDAETIEAAFAPYYRTTVLSGETDPNKLHDLKADLDGMQVYSEEDVEALVQRFLAGAARDALDPILDGCVAVYLAELDEDAQVAFKGNAKAFTRTYAFLGAILPYSNAEWEKLSIFLNLLIPKLPTPKEDDLSQGILEAIDLDSYRAEVRSSTTIELEDEEGKVGPVPTSGAGGMPEPELERLSEIIREFNDLFGNISWADEDKIRRLLFEEIPEKVLADPAYQNAIRNSDRQNARIEHDRVLKHVIASSVADHAELYKHFEGDPSFKQWLGDRIFGVTYQPPGSG
jgi:type I restriction enzyme R subunit